MNRFLVGGVILLATILPSQQEPTGSASELDRIEREYRVLHRQWLIDLRSGKDESISPSKVFVDRCLLAAKRHAGSDDAVPYLVWIVRNATNESASVLKALETMLSDHSEHAAWSELLGVLLHTEQMVGGDWIDDALKQLVKKNPHSEVQAGVRFVRGVRLLDDGRRVSGLADLETVLRLSKDPVLRAHVRAVLTGATMAKPQDHAMNRVLVPALVQRVSIDDHESAVRMARREGKLLLVNISGFNCASCRAMEMAVFRRPTVAGLLAARFVESRLHVDTQGALTDEQFAANHRIQESLTETLAMPTYVIVDPRTGRPVRTHGLDGGPNQWEQGFVVFLRGEAKEK